jgi:hypothetical protein
MTLVLLTGAADRREISSATFRHHPIATDVPATAGTNTRYGTPVLADFDKDGDLDFAFSTLRDKVYWFENRGTKEWIAHEVGGIPTGQLGAVPLDVNGDGWIDIVVGGVWYRNPAKPVGQPFKRFLYDSSITGEVHDMVTSDVDGDGKLDVVVLSDKHGLFWYQVPSNVAQDLNWPRLTITLDVLDSNDDIHGGIGPRGVADLDGDGDADIVLPDRWLENRQMGREWVRHSIPFGKRGPWGLSARSWIADLDKDGDADIIMTDSDQKESRAVWLENNGATPPSFRLHLLPLTAQGVRGSFHSLAVADFDLDGDLDILTAEQEDPSIPPEGATPRFFVWENNGKGFTERIIFDGRLGGHDAIAGDIDADGDIDVVSKIWSRRKDNANGGRFHADWLENLTKGAKPVR